MNKYFLILALLTMFLAPVNAQKGDKAPASQEQVVSIFMKDKTLQILNVKVGEKIEILNILGVRVYQKKADSTNVELQIDLPQGYYIVRVGDAVRKISVK